MDSRPRRIAILSLVPSHLPEMLASFSFAARRLQAALLADPRLENAEIHLIERGGVPLSEWTEAIRELDPDVVGASCYVWSLPTFALLAQAIKERRPDALVIFGGPSARPASFELAPFSPFARYVDVLALGEGERVFADLAAAWPLDPAELLATPGLAVRTPSGWTKSPAQREPLSIDDLPSPYRMGLSPARSRAYLETFRGCPMSCTFCQWGEMDASNGVLSVASLVEELTAMKALDPIGVNVVDAGLNLNARAFRNLVEAEARTGFFAGRFLDAEIYPNKLSSEHLAFLRNARATVGVGLQTIDATSLARVKRPFKLDRFAQLIGALSEVAQVSVEVILGLPGDTPAGFRRTIEYLRDLPCSVMIHHCLVLPDALMGKEAGNVTFHPITLELESGPGWTRDDMRRAGDWLDDTAGPHVERLHRGGSGRGDRLEDYVEHLVDPPWWVIRSDDWAERQTRFARDDRKATFEVASEVPSPVKIAPDRSEPVAPAVMAQIARVVSLGTRRRWSLLGARRLDDQVELTLKLGRGPLVLLARPTSSPTPAFREVGAIRFSYRGDAQALSPAESTMLEVLTELLGQWIPDLLERPTSVTPENC